jgi:predicted hydrocarbon binding protein
MPTKNISFRLPLEATEHAQIKAIAEEQGEDMTTFIRNAVRGRIAALGHTPSTYAYESGKKVGGAMTKKKLNELAELWGHSVEWRSMKWGKWTDKQEAAFEAQFEELEKECTEAGIFTEDGDIKPDLQAAYRKGKRRAHRL